MENHRANPANSNHFSISPQPELFRILKTKVDELRLEKQQAANGQYLLTGSANILALPKLTDALVGRMGVITLYPLSAVEITQGAGGLINDADIARSLGQNAVTAKNYRLLLRMIFLTFELRHWFRNIGKRLVKSPKGYLIDTSLLCHLQQIDLQRIVIRDPHLFGHVLENFVAGELLKQLAYFGHQADLLHFRTSDNKEVDFVLQKPDGALAGIEVKARDNVNPEDFKGLKELQA